MPAMNRIPCLTIVIAPPAVTATLPTCQEQTEACEHEALSTADRSCHRRSGCRSGLDICRVARARPRNCHRHARWRANGDHPACRAWTEADGDRAARCDDDGGDDGA